MHPRIPALPEAPQGQGPIGLTSGRAPSKGLGTGDHGVVVHSLALSPLQLCCRAQDRAFLQGREGTGTGPGAGQGESRQGDEAAWGCLSRVFPWLRPLCPQLDQTGQHLFCVCGTRVNILDVASGAMLRSLEQVRVGRVGVRCRCGRQPVLTAPCTLTLAPRRTRRTSLPLTSAPMTRCVGSGQEAGSSTSRPD